MGGKKFGKVWSTKITSKPIFTMEPKSASKYNGTPSHVQKVMLYKVQTHFFHFIFGKRVKGNFVVCKRITHRKTKHLK